MRSCAPSKPPGRWASTGSWAARTLTRLSRSLPAARRATAPSRAPSWVIRACCAARSTSIAADATRLTALDGVSGLDLLAYRFDGDVEAAVAATVAASSGPVIAAGSVDSPERIRALASLGVWGYTIGGAIFEGRLPGAPSVPDQIREVLRITAEADAAREVPITRRALTTAAAPALTGRPG